jgi:hypothetical protein
MLAGGAARKARPSKRRATAAAARPQRKRARAVEYEEQEDAEDLPGAEAVCPLCFTELGDSTGRMPCCATLFCARCFSYVMGGAFGPTREPCVVCRADLPTVYQELRQRPPQFFLAPPPPPPPLPLPHVTHGPLAPAPAPSLHETHAALSKGEWARAPAPPTPRPRVRAAPRARVGCMAFWFPWRRHRTSISPLRPLARS